VTACLPAGFFNHLELSDCRELFSWKLCTLFLSIVKPHENTVETEPQTTLRFLTKSHIRSNIAEIGESQLVAIMSHHFGTKVRLELGNLCRRLPLDRVNRLLRESQHLCHLKVPESLINFDGTGDSFTSNPNFLSLEMPDIVDGKISLKLMDGLALNTGLRDFILKFSVAHYKKSRTALLEKLTYLFGQVLPRCCSLSALTLALYDHCRESRELEQQNALCEEIVHCIASSRALPAKNRFGSLSSIKITRHCYVPFSEKNLVLPPNQTWDRHVSPSLVLTWCRQQRNENSAKRFLPPGIVAAAVSQINQNVVYRKTSTVAPRDSRTANAGVIYDFIYLFHRAFGMQNSGAM
jgi:hypothetical protein